MSCPQMPLLSSPARPSSLTRRRVRQLRTHASAEAAPPLVAASERLRAHFGKRRPFLTDPSLVAEDVVYEGPLCTVRGRKEYLALQERLQTTLPQRLRDFDAGEPSLFAVSERKLVLRWRARFGAALPPRALERLREDGAAPALRADGLLSALLSLSEELELSAEGLVVKHTEKVSDSSFDVGESIARFEWLTARRPPFCPPPVWYFQVLRYCSLEEAAAASGATMDDAELQSAFVAMVGRNLATGMLLGTGIYAALKFAILYSRMHSADIPL